MQLNGEPLGNGPSSFVLAELQKQAREQLRQLQREQARVQALGEQLDIEQDRLKDQWAAVEQAEAQARARESKAMALMEETRQRKLQMVQQQVGHSAAEQALEERLRSVETKERAVQDLQAKVAQHYQLVLELNHKLRARLLGLAHVEDHTDATAGAGASSASLSAANSLHQDVLLAIRGCLNPNGPATSASEPLSAANWNWLLQQHQMGQLLSGPESLEHNQPHLQLPSLHPPSPKDRPARPFATDVRPAQLQEGVWPRKQLHPEASTPQALHDSVPRQPGQARGQRDTAHAEGMQTRVPGIGDVAAGPQGTTWVKAQPGSSNVQQQQQQQQGIQGHSLEQVGEVKEDAAEYGGSKDPACISRCCSDAEAEHAPKQPQPHAGGSGHKEHAQRPVDEKGPAQGDGEMTPNKGKDKQQGEEAGWQGEGEKPSSTAAAAAAGDATPGAYSKASGGGEQGASGGTTKPGKRKRNKDSVGEQEVGREEDAAAAKSAAPAAQPMSKKKKRKLQQQQQQQQQQLARQAKQAVKGGGAGGSAVEGDAKHDGSSKVKTGKSPRSRKGDAGGQGGEAGDDRNTPQQQDLGADADADDEAQTESRYKKGLKRSGSAQPTGQHRRPPDHLPTPDSPHRHNYRPGGQGMPNRLPHPHNQHAHRGASLNRYHPGRPATPPGAYYQQPGQQQGYNMNSNSNTQQAYWQPYGGAHHQPGYELQQPQYHHPDHSAYQQAYHPASLMSHQHHPGAYNMGVMEQFGPTAVAGYSAFAQNNPQPAYASHADGSARWQQSIPQEPGIPIPVQGQSLWGHQPPSAHPGPPGPLPPPQPPPLHPASQTLKPHQQTKGGDVAAAGQEGTCESGHAGEGASSKGKSGGAASQQAAALKPAEGSAATATDTGGGQLQPQQRQSDTGAAGHDAQHAQHQHKAGKGSEDHKPTRRFLPVTGSNGSGSRSGRSGDRNGHRGAGDTHPSGRPLIPLGKKGAGAMVAQRMGKGSSADAMRRQHDSDTESLQRLVQQFRQEEAAQQKQSKPEQS